MTRHAMRQEYEPALEPVDETVDHVRGRGHCRRGRPSKTGSGTCTSRSSAIMRHSPMTTCGGMPPTWGSTSHGSAATGAANGARGCVRRDVESGMASGEVRGTPTLFIDVAVHRGAYDAATLLEALAR
jgi:hypothetical protein